MSKRDKDIEFYTRLWEGSNKKCQVSGKFLGIEPLFTFFHHVLSKSSFPQYRWCEWNIMIVDPEIHAQIELDIDRVPEAKRITQELMKKHLNNELNPCYE